MSRVEKKPEPMEEVSPPRGRAWNRTAPRAARRHDGVEDEDRNELRVAGRDLSPACSGRRRSGYLCVETRRLRGARRPVGLRLAPWAVCALLVEAGALSGSSAARATSPVAVRLQLNFAVEAYELAFSAERLPPREALLFRSELPAALAVTLRNGGAQPAVVPEDWPELLAPRLVRLDAPASDPASEEEPRKETSSELAVRVAWNAPTPGEGSPSSSDGLLVIAPGEASERAGTLRRDSSEPLAAGDYRLELRLEPARFAERVPALAGAAWNSAFAQTLRVRVAHSESQRLDERYHHVRRAVARGELERGIELAKELLAMRPRSTRTLHVLARAYASKGRHRAAADTYQRLYELLLAEEDPDARYTVHELQHELIPQVREALDEQLRASHRVGAAGRSAVIGSGEESPSPEPGASEPAAEEEPTP